MRGRGGDGQSEELTCATTATRAGRARSRAGLLDHRHGLGFWTTVTGWPPDNRARHPVARQAVLDPVMTSKIVRSMVGDGLVLRRDDPADSRALHVTLTAAGRSRAAQGVEVVLATERAFIEGLGLDLGDLRQTLETISGLHSRARR